MLQNECEPVRVPGERAALLAAVIIDYGVPGSAILFGMKWRFWPEGAMSAPAIRAGLARAESLDLSDLEHPYGAGEAHRIIADSLTRIDPHAPALQRKRNSY